MLAEHHVKNFKTLMTASDHGDVALMDCRLRATGEPVAVICAINQQGDEFQFVPFALMFNGNPYELVDPPPSDLTAIEVENGT